ncbi:MAG TPA: hypothetical protein VMW51_11185, partial [Terriglobia bacterium]|nr:hypothetical protein [Terriglobia bacterium]
PAREDPTTVLDDFAAGMAAGANVRGVMVGRNVSFASREDPRALAAAVCGVVHEHLPPKDSREILAAERGQQMDLFAPWR